MRRFKAARTVRRVSGDDMRRLQDATRDFAARLRRDFSQEIASNPRDFKKQVLCLIRRELPPGRGRPTNPQVEAALGMLSEGKTVREILRTQITGFGQLDTYGQMLAEKALRQALARKAKERRSQNHHSPESCPYSK